MIKETTLDMGKELHMGLYIQHSICSSTDRTSLARAYYPFNSALTYKLLQDHNEHLFNKII